MTSPTPFAQSLIRRSCAGTHTQIGSLRRKQIIKPSMRIYEHLQYLNTNTTLYNAIVKAESEGALLSEESRKAANNLRADFEKGGIHLPKDKLERVNQLNLAIAHLGRK
ncbi:putative mitochondrial intermediate peptidase, mitochondrial [Hordeum vulgare]|nr:putative mitochondrial intermediate peptidase, mitochondrial [Hordeum vulgare]